MHIDALMQPHQLSCVLCRQLYGFGVPLSLGWGTTESPKGRKRTLQVSLKLTSKQHTHIASQNPIHGHWEYLMSFEGAGVNVVKSGDAQSLSCPHRKPMLRRRLSGRQQRTALLQPRLLHAW